MASHWNLSPAAGSLPGKKLMVISWRPAVGHCPLELHPHWAFNLAAF